MFKLFSRQQPDLKVVGGQEAPDSRRAPMGSDPLTWWPRIVGDDEALADDGKVTHLRPKQPGVTVTADVRSKRLADRHVDDDRYTATVTAASRSPYDLVRALAEAFADIEELRQPAEQDQHVILQINLAG